jgi:protein-disulfide isomerase
MAPRTASQLTHPVSHEDHISGAASAPITLVEYGDYQCPYCGQAYPIVKALQKRLGKRLRFVFRNFPLANAHPNAQPAAEAAEAAGAQGKFWEMHDSLYENQTALEDQDLIRYAGELGLDVARFTRELGEHHYAARVREDFRTGVRSGVNGTPSFFINGVRHDGSYDLDSLLAGIEAATE